MSAAGVDRLLVCRWQETDDDGFPIGGPICGEKARYISCKPLTDTPTCAAHKCRCARLLTKKDIEAIVGPKPKKRTFVPYRLYVYWTTTKDMDAAYAMAFHDRICWRCGNRFGDHGKDACPPPKYEEARAALVACSHPLACRNTLSIVPSGPSADPKRATPLMGWCSACGTLITDEGKEIRPDYQKAMGDL